jgi:hypothetical protein
VNRISRSCAEQARRLPIDRWSSIESAIRRNEAHTNSLAESLVRCTMFHSQPLILPAAAPSAQQVARPILLIGAQDAAAQLPVDALRARTLPIDTTSILGTAVRLYEAQSNSIINSIFRSMRSDSQPVTAAAAAASVARQIPLRCVQDADQRVEFSARTLPIDRASLSGTMIHREETQTDSLVESIVRSMMVASQPTQPPSMVASTIPQQTFPGSTVQHSRSVDQDSVLQSLLERGVVPEQQTQAQLLLNVLAEALCAPKNDNDTRSSSLPR